MMFIKLTTANDIPVRINMALIHEYRRLPGSDETVMYTGPGTDDVQVRVKETPEEIDALIGI